MSNDPLSKQSKIMLDWFITHGVTSVDIHLRCPKFKGADYYSQDWFWLTRHEKQSLNQALKLLPWCRLMNYKGADIYVRPHRHSSQPVIFLDDLNFEQAKKVSKKYRSLIIETSQGNTQLWLALTKSISESERKQQQQYISNLGYGDPGSISGEHLGRLCGFKSQKRLRWVKYISSSCSQKYRPLSLKPTPLPRRGACAINLQSGKYSQSEKDFSWVLSSIRKGESVSKLINHLTVSAECRGKPSPNIYAERTVRKAMMLI